MYNKQNIKVAANPRSHSPHANNIKEYNINYNKLIRYLYNNNIKIIGRSYINARNVLSINVTNEELLCMKLALDIECHNTIDEFIKALFNLE